MIQARNSPRFALEALAPRWVFGEVFGQHLDGNVPIQPLVLRPVHLTHPSLADLFDDAVVTKGATDEILHN
jgi:hypothetical protein